MTYGRSAEEAALSDAVKSRSLITTRLHRETLELKCVACERDVLVEVFYQVKMGPIEKTEDGTSAKADLVPTGARYAHDCVPRATR